MAKEIQNIKNDIKDINQQQNDTTVNQGKSYMDQLEKRVRSLEDKVEDMSLAIELIKQYGFNPKEYNEMIEILKSQKNKQEQQVVKYEAPKYAEINPLEKLQMALLMLFISMISAYLVVHNSK